jgi:RNA polymerase sigma-70 factor (ECF subfamily)
MTSELDPAVLSRARAGEPWAFRALYEHHSQAVHLFLVRMLRDEAAAEDALQDAFLRVLGALGRFDPAGPARLSTWIFTIARRVALNVIAEREVRARHAPPPPPPAPDTRDLRLLLAAAIAALPDVLRSTFVLRECCELSYEEVAVVEAVDLGTVKSRLHRARAALQEALARETDSDDTRSKERSAHDARATR